MCWVEFKRVDTVSSMLLSIFLYCCSFSVFDYVLLGVDLSLNGTYHIIWVSSKASRSWIAHSVFFGTRAPFLQKREEQQWLARWVLRPWSQLQCQITPITMWFQTCPAPAMEPPPHQARGRKSLQDIDISLPSTREPEPPAWAMIQNSLLVFSDFGILWSSLATSIGMVLLCVDVVH